MDSKTRKLAKATQEMRQLQLDHYAGNEGGISNLSDTTIIDAEDWNNNIYKLKK